MESDPVGIELKPAGVEKKNILSWPVLFKP